LEPRAMPDLMRSKWTLPAFSVLMGLVMLGAATAGGRVLDGLEMLGVMAVAGLAFVLGGRWSETIRGLRGDGRDERFQMLDLRATAYTGLVLILAIIGGFLVEIARGHSGDPYTWLGAIGGLAYLASVVYLRLRG
ncbi:MAG: hypothetical protein J2P45_15355, partial [Candidatus Dormibacteraeota bacterium]|nr:hypothetical protein [Candidatus Dormibacteraeota bacterium]